MRDLKEDMEKPANFPADPASRPCWSCGAVISGADNYCKKCGVGQGSYLPWRYKHWGVLAVTLLGLGPFSLYYVWKSPVISREARYGYTALILAFTLFVINSFYKLIAFYQSMGIDGL